MLRYITALIFVIHFFAFGVVAQPQRVLIVRPLINYFMENTVHLNNGMNCFVITKQSDFRKMFGIAKTMDNKIVEPDFAKEDVIVIAMPATNHDMVLTYTDAIRAGDFIEVYCKVQHKKYPLSYEVEHVCAGIIPKYADVKKVRFYDERRKLIGEVRVN
jgi:hypothetical protein